MKKLPLSIQNFDELIATNCVYVDKTRLVYKMASEGKFYFLSRPRRFGKSLLVSTLKKLFEGRRDLFKGLWLESADWDWKPHPVLHLDFSEITNETPEQLKEGIWLTLTQIAEEHGLSVSSKLLSETFKEVLVGLSRKAGEKVVVLVDEYDKPLVNHLGKGEAELEIAKQNRDVLRNFFGVLKGGNVNEALQFVFITGISKFARVSIFSELNNLDDITMQEPYCALLGYTEEEMELYFGEHLKQLTQRLKKSHGETIQQTRAWYNGYRFSDLNTKVYNPFSVLKLLQQSKFQNYWFETATPSFLVNLIKEKKYPIADIESLQLQEASLSAYDLDHLELEPLLLQTGYLTIHDYDGERYRLGYPNQEVKSAFLGYLYKSFSAIPNTALREQYSRLHEYLAKEQLDLFIETTNAILSAIPYSHIAGQDEHFYHTVFYLMLGASGVLVQTEVLTSQGRIDMEVYFPERIYIVELKCNQSSEQAIAQIKAKKYFERHAQSGKKIFLLGINFSTAERRIVDWLLEEVKA